MVRTATKKRGLLAKGRSVLLVGIIAGSVGAFPEGSFAKKPGNLANQASCGLSQSAVGDLIASGGRWASATRYEYQIYSAPQASVGGGQLSTDASGNFSDDLGPLSFFMNVYANETTLTFVVYPIIGNKADLNAALASCSITPVAAP
jgi:hypothetical protein